MASTVSLCMIVRDEVANLGNLLADVTPIIEEIIIVDTGSSDGTIELVQELAALHPQIHLHHLQWQDDFAAARDYSFSLATQEWILWLDGDDRIDTGKLAAFKEQILDSDDEVDSWSLRYLYAIDADGTPLKIIERERFVRRSTRPTWSPRIHEKIAVDLQRCRFFPDLEVVHQQGLKPHAGERNLRILRAEHARDPDDPETIFFLASGLWHSGDLESVELLERFIAMPNIRTPLEIYARFHLGEYYHADSRPEAVLDMAHAIYRLDHTRRRSESYYLWGLAEQALGHQRVAIAWFERCLDDNRDWPRRSAIEHYSETDLRTWMPLRRIAECHAALGRRQEVQRTVNRLRRYLPDDEESREWQAGIEEILDSSLSGRLG